jgi:hypothetical protein
MAQGYEGLPSYYSASSNPITPNLGLSLIGCDPIVAEDFVLIDSAFGGIMTSIKVNGIIVPPVPNFINSTSVIFSVTGSNITASAISAATPPGGVSTNLQFNNSGVFGGATGSSVDPVYGGISLAPEAGGSNPALLITSDGSNPEFRATDSAGDTFTVDMSPGFSYFEILDAPSSALIFGYAANNNSALSLDDGLGDQISMSSQSALCEVSITDSTVDFDTVLLQSSSGTPSLSFQSNTSVPVPFISFTVGSTSPPTLKVQPSSVQTSWTLTFPPNAGTAGYVLQTDGTGVTSWVQVASSGGTVTNFSAGNIATIITSSVATSTTTPALTFSLSTQAANTVWAGPTTGAAAMPTFRALVAADIPALPYLTNPMTTAGDIIYENATPAPARLGIGTTGQVLTVVGGLPAWAAPATSGTVTSFSAGALSPLFTTSVATSTTTPALTFSLTNAAGGTVFGNPTGSVGAPSYTAAPVLGVNTSLAGTLGLATSVASGATITLQNLGALTAYNFNLPITAGAAGSVLTSQAGGSASMTWTTEASLGVAWSSLTNASANLTLANAGFTTTFNQTSAVAWLWANTTTGTAITTNASPLLELSAQYYTGSTTGTDLWTIGSSLSAGTNGNSTLTYAHSGSSGAASITFGNSFGFASVIGGSAATLTVGSTAAGLSADGGIYCGFVASSNGTNFKIGIVPSTPALRLSSDTPLTFSSTVDETGTKDTGVSRISAGLLGVGNGTAGDFSGSLKLTNITMGSNAILNNTSGNLIVEPFAGLVLANTGDTLATWLFNPNLTPPLNRLSSTTALAWGSGDAVATAQDVQISRSAVGTLAIGTTYNNANPALGNLQLNRINTGGADLAGQATITAGSTTVDVVFAANYTGTGQPVVVITPTSDPIVAGVPLGQWVTYAGSAGAWTGFTINISATLVANVTFNYIVIGKA